MFACATELVCLKKRCLKNFETITRHHTEADHLKKTRQFYSKWYNHEVYFRDTLFQHEKQKETPRIFSPFLVEILRALKRETIAVFL